MHALFPQRTTEDVARHAFLMELKAVIAARIRPQIRHRFETQLASAFQVVHGGIAPDSQEMVSRFVESDAAWRWYSALSRAQQELYVDATAECVERQAVALRNRFVAVRSAQPRGTLHLDPTLSRPEYHSAVDIHCVPGGYSLELMPDDVYAGARYELGVSLYTLGRHGQRNDSKGQTGVAFLRRRFPDFRPSRILDLGCTCGNSTLPYAEAWPGAQVHAIDLSAPVLRYAHARAELLGSTIHFRQANAEATPYAAASFDLIVSHILLHETSRQAVANIFRECRRLLRPGGVMLHVEVPVRNAHLDLLDRRLADWDTDHNNEVFWRGLHELDVGALIASAGFPPESVFDEEFSAGQRAFNNGRPWWLVGARAGGVS